MIQTIIDIDRYTYESLRYILYIIYNNITYYNVVYTILQPVMLLKLANLIV